MDEIYETDREVILAELIKSKGTAIIIGTTDSGKSTLAQYFMLRLLSEGIPVSLVDADVGQSSLGLPGTISMRTFLNEEDLADFSFDRMSFMGTVNPAANIPLITGTAKMMVGICRRKTEAIFIDTTGLVSGEAGKKLKTEKINAIEPEYIIALQSGNELQHILDVYDNHIIRRIRTSRRVKVRNTGERIRYRERKLRDYFNKKRGEEFLFYLNEVRFMCNGKIISPKEIDVSEGALIGLNHDEDTLALGIITEISGNSISLRSPVESMKRINRVVLGDLKL